MGRVKFAIALHFHQPVGNFTEVFDRVYDRCYRPFLEYLPYYPDIKLTLHISGSLLDYFKKERPEILELIKGLLSKGQIELMGGPYYEPILPAIPSRDIKGQVELMSKAMRDEFKYKPSGMWIPERVWQPAILKDLLKTGMSYCILDDTHLLRAGLKKEDTYGYFTTGGPLKNIAVFSSDKMLRYIIPFKGAEETIKYFKEVSKDRDESLLVYADDVEKFGEWPGTYDLVYKKGWLKGFFDQLSRNKEWIETVRLSDYMKSHRPLGKIFIPEASYEEMMEWTGGSWFNFLKMYPETDHMYRKMRYVSDKVNSFQKGLFRKRRDLYWSKVELYRGECNCGYWHGVFGGLYMYHLRSAIYNHLIAAENIVDNALHGKRGYSKVRNLDIDGDGKDEFIIENNKISAYFDPEEGGALKELDYRPICANLIDTVSRKKERYHKKVKEENPLLAGGLVYDRYPRYCLRDYFFKEGVGAEELRSVSFKDLGGFPNGPYTAHKKKTGIVLSRKSSISGIPVELSKSITVIDSTIEVLYNILNKGSGRLTTDFGVEFNLTMPHLNSERYRYFSNGRLLGMLNEKGMVKDTGSFEIRDLNKEMEMDLGFAKEADRIFYFPVKTIAQSQMGYNAAFQCSSIFPLWKIDIDKGCLYRLKIKWEIGK